MPDDFVQRGKGLLVRREFAEVVEICRQGLTEYPDALDGRLLLGTALLALKRYDEAIIEMRIAEGQEPTNVLVHLLRGEALLRRGDTQDAIEALAEAHALDPSNKIAAKLYNEALERAHGPVDEGAPEALVDEMSGRALEPGPMYEPGPEPPPMVVEDATEIVEPLPPAAPPPRRRRWPWVVAVAAGLVIAGGGVGTVFWVQASRRAEESRSRRSEAAKAAASQTFPGYRHAIEIDDQLAAEGDAAAAADALRLRAASTFEFGSPADPSADKPPAADRDGQVTEVYRLLVGTERSAALRDAQLVATAFPDDAEAAYLVGRAAIRSHDVGAVPALKRSVALSPTPLAFTALGEAEAADGRMDDALRAFDGALALVPGHPAALIARARTLAASGRLPAGEEPDRSLARLADPGADQEPLVSPAQAHLAGLALAEVKLARGDVTGAQTLLAAVAPTEPQDPRFGGALVTALLAGGDLAGAEREAESWKKSMPASGAPHVWLARVALARDRPDAARAELDQAGDAKDTPSALVVLGEIELAAGRIDAAITALDKALALRAADRDAQVLRARADLARGDSAAAEARLAALYEAGRDPVVGVALGESLLARDAGPQARAVLEESVTKLEASGVRPKLIAGASLALARLARNEGRWSEAQKAIARTLATDARNVDARLLEAELHADVGDALGARTALDTLAVAAHTDARVLLAAARAHALTGDPKGARPLLDAAAGLGGAPKGELAEVGARVLLLENKPEAAAAALLAGTGPETPAAALVLIDALIDAGKVDDAEAAAVEVEKRWPGKPEESLAHGRIQLANKDASAAISSFTTALQRLEAGAASAQSLANARTWLGRAQEVAGKLDEALASYREAVRMSPTGGAGAVLLGRALMTKGDYGNAENVLSQAVKLNPSHAEAYYYLGHAAKGLRKPREARQAWQTYLDLAPHGEQAEAAAKMIQEQ